MNQQSDAYSEKSTRSGWLWLSLLLPVWGAYVFYRFLQQHPWPVQGWVRTAGKLSAGDLLPTLAGVCWIASHIAWLMLIFVVAFFVGSSVLRLLRLSFSNHSMQWFLYSEALGFAIFMMLSFVLGILGLYTKPAVWAVGGALVLLTIPEELRTIRLAADWLRADRSNVPAKKERALRFATRFVLVVTIVLLVAIAVVALTPAVDWDSQSYHLNIPKRYAVAHGIVPITFNMFANMPHYMELLYVIGMILQDYVLCKLIHFGFGVLLLLLIYDFAKHRFSPRIALLTLPIFLFNEDIISCFALSFVDLALAFFYLLSVDCLLRWLKGSERVWLLLCGFLLGICLGMKLTIALGVVPITLIAGWRLFVTRRGRFRESLALAAYFSVALLIPVVPWFVKSALYVGNPMYPALYNIFGGREMNASLANRWDLYLDRGFGMPKTPINYVLLPWNATIYGQRDFRLFGSTVTPLWLILLPFLLIVSQKRRLARFLAGVVVAYYFLWMFYIHYTRYAIPMFPLLSLLAAYTVDWLFFVPHLGFPRIIQRAMAALCVAMIVLVAFPLFASRTLGSVTGFLPVVVGAKNRQVFEYEYNSNYFLYDHINTKLPADSRILFVWDNRAFFSDRDVVADVHPVISHIFDMFSRFATTEEAAEYMREMGITHVLVNTLFRAKTPDYLNTFFVTHPEEQRRLEWAEAVFQDFIKERCTLLYSSGGVELYEINPSSAAYADNP